MSDFQNLQEIYREGRGSLVARGGGFPKAEGFKHTASTMGDNLSSK